MSGYSDQWVTPTSEALRARRAEARRRLRRRRRVAMGLMLALVAGAIAAGLLLTQPWAHAARARGVVGVSRRRVHHVRLRPTPAQLAALTVVRENDAIGRLLGRQPFISAGGGARREIALTFDDGPGPYTPRILSELRRLHAPATFFEVGFMFRWFRGAASRALHMGDAIGDHTETHPRMALLPPAAQRAQILDQTDWLRGIGAPFPRLWRPPYGSYNAATLKILGQLHMIMVLWTVDTDDYLRPGVAIIVRRALARARPGAIILLHDGGGDRSQTAAALPLIVHALRKRGYVLVTVPRLILDDPPRGRQALPERLAGG